MLRGSREKRKLKVTPEKRMRKYDAERASEGIRGGVRPNRGSSKPYPNIPIRCEGRWAREIGVCVMEKCRIE
jgi:hypothetical protein